MNKDSFKLVDSRNNKEISHLNIEKQLPSLYQILLLEQLVTRLKKPENKDKFKVQLSGLNSHVKIELNTLADSQISLSGLYYSDAFATFDKGQAQLIKFLFPEHTDKIKLYIKDKDQKTYSSVDLEKL